MYCCDFKNIHCLLSQVANVLISNGDVMSLFSLISNIQDPLRCLQHATEKNKFFFNYVLFLSDFEFNE